MKKTIILSLLSFTTLAGPPTGYGCWQTWKNKMPPPCTTWDWTSALTKYIARRYQPERCRGTFLAEDAPVKLFQKDWCWQSCADTDISSNTVRWSTTLPDRRILGDDPQGRNCLARGWPLLLSDKIHGYHSLCKRTIKDKDQRPELPLSFLPWQSGRTLWNGRTQSHSLHGLGVETFHWANRYYLFVKTIYKDVPHGGAHLLPSGLEPTPDNWMWPPPLRYSPCSAYMLPPMANREYNEIISPMRIINLGGVKGDFTFVMGFPGRNWRYMISDGWKNVYGLPISAVRQCGTPDNNLLEEMLKSDKVRISMPASIIFYQPEECHLGMNEGLILQCADTRSVTKKTSGIRPKNGEQILIKSIWCHPRNR